MLCLYKNVVAGHFDPPMRAVSLDVGFGVDATR